MWCAVVRNLSQKLGHLEGSTASMADPVDVKRPYARIIEASVISREQDVRLEMLLSTPLTKS